MRNLIRIPIKILLSPIHLLLNVFLLLSEEIMYFVLGIMTYISIFFLLCTFFYMYKYSMDIHMILPPILLTLMFSPIGIPFIIVLIYTILEGIRNFIRNI